MVTKCVNKSVMLTDWGVLTADGQVLTVKFVTHSGKFWGQTATSSDMASALCIAAYDLHYAKKNDYWVSRDHDSFGRNVHLIIDLLITKYRKRIVLPFMHKIRFRISFWSGFFRGKARNGAWPCVSSCLKDRFCVIYAQQNKPQHVSLHPKQFIYVCTLVIRMIKAKL